MPTAAQPKFYRYFPVADRDRDWGLSVTTVGEFHFGPGRVCPPPDQPKRYDFHAPAGRLLQEYQLVYVSAGRGWFHSKESGKMSVEAGSVIFLFPDVRHTYAPLVTTGWKEHWLGFNGDWVRRLTRNGFFSPDRPILQAGNEEQLLFLFNEIIEAARTNPAALQQIMAGITMRILALLYSVQQSHPARDDRGSQVIHTAVIRMRELRETNIDIVKLAEELKVSYRWFRAAFVRHTGMSPHQYFMEIRLAQARALLMQTPLSTKEIALRIGFDDPQYFCRLFRKKVGIAPGAWRTQAVKNQTNAASS